MVTSTAQTTSLLDEASAILEAEWIRLQQDESLWERELADLHSPRPALPRVGVTTAARPLPGPLWPADSRRCATRRPPAKPVWATQRSPPSPSKTCSKGTVRQGR